MCYYVALSNIMYSIDFFSGVMPVNARCVKAVKECLY